MESLDKRIAMVKQRVRNINLGGCGAFALELHSILKEEHGIDAEIGYTGYRAGKQICFDHIFLHIPGEGAFVDSNGVKRISPREYRGNKMTREELAELVKDKSRWNKAFHYHFQDQYFQVISNEDFLIRQMRNYISDKIR